MLDAAHTLFAQRGFAAVTMDEVATEVGVTKPLLYAYFGNKDRLYLGCMERAGESLLRTVVDAVQAAEGPADATARGLRAFFGFLDADREAWSVLFDETLPAGGEIAAQVAEYRERLAQLVSGSLLAQMPERRRAKAAVEVEALSTALLGAAESLARWWLRTQAIPAEQAADLLIATVEPGLLARTRTRGETE
jgi:AcrR family transcriptional regulator